MEASETGSCANSKLQPPLLRLLKIQSLLEQASSVNKLIELKSGCENLEKIVPMSMWAQYLHFLNDKGAIDAFEASTTLMNGQGSLHEC